MNAQKELLEAAWLERNEPHFTHEPEVRQALAHTLEALDQGRVRIAQKENGVWIVQEWLKKALLLSFRLEESAPMSYPLPGFDKIASKFETWTPEHFKVAKIRVVPGALVRYASYIGPRCVLMPSFINFGAYVDAGTMIDIGAGVASCAQIGKQCHLSAGVMIGGVVEPLSQRPVILEDNVFVGAHATIVEGVLVEEGAVIGLGTKLGASTPIFDRETGVISYGLIPSHSVVVPGCLPSEKGVSLACAVIVKRVDARTREKTAINDLLRL